MLGLTRISQYCPTRLLSLYSVLDGICHQFPILKKIVSISNHHELITVINSDSFLVHLDQFIVHVAPIYAFVKCNQGLTMNIYDCKLLMRLGHVVSLSTKSYYNKLYENGKPIFFKSKNVDIRISTNNKSVNEAMEQLSDDALKSIKTLWDSFNEDQLQRLLDRFSDFLGSPLVRYSHTLFTKSTEFTDATLSRFKRLVAFISCNNLKAVDELSTLRCKTEFAFRLAEVYTSNGLAEFECLTQIVESVLLVLPHNMVVEAGFSRMKFTESQYQTNLECRTYDCLRLISDYFDRETFEKYEPPEELLCLMKTACATYKAEGEDRKKETKHAEEERERLQRAVGVYRRRKSSVVNTELQSLERQLSEVQKAVEEIQAKKAKLETEKQFAQERGTICRLK